MEKGGRKRSPDGEHGRRRCRVKKAHSSARGLTPPQLWSVRTQTPCRADGVRAPLCFSHAVATPTQGPREERPGRTARDTEALFRAVGLSTAPPAHGKHRRGSPVGGKPTNAETHLTKSSGSRSGLTPRASSTSFRIWSSSSESSPKVSPLGSLPLSVRNFRSTGGGGGGREVREQVFSQ